MYFELILCEHNENVKLLLGKHVLYLDLELDAFQMQTIKNNLLFKRENSF